MKVFCIGDNCPIKEDCARYAEVIDLTTMVHLSEAPHNGEECEFFIKKENDESNPK